MSWITVFLTTNTDEAMEIDISKTCDVLRYINRKFGEVKYQLDRIDESPPPAEWPFESTPPRQLVSEPQALA